MENMEIDKKFWRNKRVLITGNTGFMGSWLYLWLSMLGANIRGYSLDKSFNKNLFNCFPKELKSKTIFGDIRNYKKLKKIIVDFKPEFVFHLAAQPYVSEGFKDPINTYEVNINGTLYLLDILKNKSFCKFILNVTSDKCYFNNDNSKNIFNENDKICGDDPYSNSKSCSELLNHTYIKTIYSNQKIKLCSARSGNVIGGGDRGTNRIFPDLMSYYFDNKKLNIRSINSTRPWQYILDLIKGYLVLAKKSYMVSNRDFSGPWNFSSDTKNHKSVRDLIEFLNRKYKNIKYKKIKNPIKEKNYLHISNKKIKSILNFNYKYNFEDMLSESFSWYHFQSKNSKNKLYEFSKEKILNYYQK